MAGRTSRRALIVAVLCLVPLAGACKEGDPLGSSITPATPAFEAVVPPPGVTSDYVSIAVSSIQGNTIFLDVVVTEIDELISGVELKLTYPSAFAKFIAVTDGSLFPSGGILNSNETAPGQVLLARNIVQTGATTVSGAQVVMQVEFLIFGVSEGPLVFEGQNLGGSDASAVLDDNGAPIPVQWFAGQLRGD